MVKSMVLHLLKLAILNGVEDMYGGGDRDFNDIVIQMNIKAI